MKTFSEFTSSNIMEPLEYDTDSYTVYVTYKDRNGNKTAKWAYWPVDTEIWNRICTSSSVGASVNKELVRSGTYESKRVD